MIKTHSRYLPNINVTSKLGLIITLLLLSACSLLDYDVPYKYLSHKHQGSRLVIQTGSGEVQFFAVSNDAIEVVYPNRELQLPSFAIAETAEKQALTIAETDQVLIATNGQLAAHIQKKDLSVSFYFENRLLTEQKKYIQDKAAIIFEFSLDRQEKLFGAGQRVVGMDRRGTRLPLYNKAHYGYTTHSEQMYYSLPVVSSNKKYTIVFDNTAKGWVDLGKTQENILSFEAVGGRSAYIVTAAESYPALINRYVDLTGKQPMPPRWALGNYASRFGYKSESQVRQVVDQFHEKQFPIDAVILDLFWFGPDIKGHMGNLDWDRETFPTPDKMIADLKKRDVKTIVITEPFVLSTSKLWQEAVDAKVLAIKENGDPYRFDFYFGNTGLIDVFNDRAKEWFWQHYQSLFNQGVAGTWGDLGEPEVHPDDILHRFSAVDSTVRGDRLHNAYGHEWAKLVYENQRVLQPNERPFIMMRSGFAGSQRFGMIPWTGDVARSWGGLKPQVELALQMGMHGLAYTHSDLGGFAGGEKFDKELYIRWMQYGVFQPVYRPHAQDHIAPEPIFHDKETQSITRDFINLRYQLMPYTYTLAYENAMTGMPMMRPLMFSNEEDPNLFDNQDSYLWGDAFLVSPITEPHLTEKSFYVPEGVWFDFWSNQRIKGGQVQTIPVSLKTIPVLLKAGAFVPMVNNHQSSEFYTSEELNISYWHDETIKKSQGKMFEDDGVSFDTISREQFDLLEFASINDTRKLIVNLKQSGAGYQQMPGSRKITFSIMNWQKRPAGVLLGGVPLHSDAIHFDIKKRQLTVQFSLSKRNQSLEVIK